MSVARCAWSRRSAPGEDLLQVRGRLARRLTWPNSAVPRIYRNKQAGITPPDHRDRRRAVGSSIAFAGQMFGLEVRIYGQGQLTRSPAPPDDADLGRRGSSPTLAAHRDRPPFRREPDNPWLARIAISGRWKAAAAFDTNYTLGSVLNPWCCTRASSAWRRRAARQGSASIPTSSVRRRLGRRHRLPLPRRWPRQRPRCAAWPGLCRPLPWKGHVRLRRIRLHPLMNSGPCRPGSMPAACAAMATRRWCRTCCTPASSGRRGAATGDLRGGVQFARAGHHPGARVTATPSVRPSTRRSPARRPARRRPFCST